MLTWKGRIDNIDYFKGKEIYHLPHTINFATIDGYINFSLAVINFELSINKNKEMIEHFKKIREYFSKLYLKNIEHKKGANFVDYCERMSNILDDVEVDQDGIEKNLGWFEKFGDTEINENFLFVYKGKYDDENNVIFEKYVEQELMKALNSFRINPEKLGATYLTTYGCHVEIINAINFLMTIVVYLINCTSNRQEKEFYEFDRMRIDADIESFEFTINRIKDITGIN